MVADIVPHAHVTEDEESSVSVEMQSDDSFTLGIPAWLGQSSNRGSYVQSRVFWGLRFIVEGIPSVPLLKEKHFPLPWLGCASV